MPCTAMVLVQNPMARSFSSTLGSSTLDEWEFQIIPRAPFLNAWECGKLNNVSKAIHGRPTLLTTTKGDWSSWWTMHEWRLGSNMSSTKHVGDLGMNTYVHWNTSSGARLVHIHWNQWVREPIEVTSICTSLSIQGLIYCHPTKTVGLESPNGGTFSNKYAHMWLLQMSHNMNQFQK
jgi:hypothetical protein